MLRFALRWAGLAALAGVFFDHCCPWSDARNSGLAGVIPSVVAEENGEARRLCVGKTPRHHYLPKRQKVPNGC